MLTLVLAVMSDMSWMICINRGTVQFSQCLLSVMLEEFTNADVNREMFLKSYTVAGQGGVHRVAVFDAHGAITRIVSQLDVMRSAAPALRHPLHLVNACE